MYIQIINPNSLGECPKTTRLSDFPKSLSCNAFPLFDKGIVRGLGCLNYLLNDSKDAIVKGPECRLRNKDTNVTSRTSSMNRGHGFRTNANSVFCNRGRTTSGARSVRGCGDRLLFLVSNHGEGITVVPKQLLFHSR